jgi:hypothetical protein
MPTRHRARFCAPVASALVALICCAPRVRGREEAASPEEFAPFAPGRLIVKLKPESAGKLRAAGYGTRASGLPHFNLLNANYNVTGIRPLYCRRQQAGAAAPARPARAQQQYNARRFPRRAARAGRPRLVPALENACVLELAPGDDAWGWDFNQPLGNGDNDPSDGHGHGTHCAGTIAPQR